MPQLIKRRRDRRRPLARCCATPRVARRPARERAGDRAARAMARAARRAGRARRRRRVARARPTIPAALADDVDVAAADRGRLPEVHRRPRLFDRAAAARAIRLSRASCARSATSCATSSTTCAQCGFDAFALRDGPAMPHDALAGLRDFTDGYQATADRATPLVPPPRDARAAGRRPMDAAMTLAQRIDDARGTLAAHAIARATRPAVLREQLRRRGHGADST